MGYDQRAVGYANDVGLFSEEYDFKKLRNVGAISRANS